MCFERLFERQDAASLQKIGITDVLVVVTVTVVAPSPPPPPPPPPRLTGAWGLAMAMEARMEMMMEE